VSFGRWRRLGALAVVVAVGMDKWDEFVHTGGWDVGARLPLALGVEAADRVMAASRDFHQIGAQIPDSAAVDTRHHILLGPLSRTSIGFRRHRRACQRGRASVG
jgi:hypothetical protein